MEISPISRSKARKLLGSSFDSRKTDEELSEMLRTIGHTVVVKKGPSPPEQFVVQRVTESSPPEDKLAVLRARQIAGHAVDPDEYKKLRQEVIDKVDPKVHVLWLYLERTYDCEVCELVEEKRRSRSIYGFKIRTSKGTFLDWATREDLLSMLDELGIRK